MQKRISTFLFVLFLLCVLSAGAAAHDVPDLGRPGSITVGLQDDGKKLSSGSLTFYRVGQIVSRDGNYEFRLTEPFADSGVSLEEVHSPDLAKKLLSYGEKQRIPGKTLPIRDGVVTFRAGTGELGLYLVAQKEASQGYAPIDPFLIAVPNAQEDGYVYEVDATPKVDLETEAPTQPPAPPPSGPKLPHTGQWKFPVPVLAIAGLCLIGGGLLLRLGEKKERHET